MKKANGLDDLVEFRTKTLCQGTSMVLLSYMFEGFHWNASFVSNCPDGGFRIGIGKVFVLSKALKIVLYTT